MKMNIVFSTPASLYIYKKIEEAQGCGFRLSVKETGCSGYEYLPSIVTTINPNDLLFEIENGVKIFVDKTWFSLLQDLKIDYVEDISSGLKQNRLTFTNPKETSRCGCGKSFHVESTETDIE